MDILETNETKFMHRTIFRASNVSSVAMTTMTFENDEFGDPHFFFCIKTFLLVLVISPQILKKIL